MSNYQHKRSQVAGKVPLAGDLLEGEIAVNIKDRKLFSKDDQGVVFEFLGGNSGGVETVNGISPVSGNVTLNALNIPPTADRLWLTQAERQLIAGFDAYDKTESDDRYLLEDNNLSDLTNAATARTNLGLGTAATRDVGESNGNVMEVGAFGVGAVVISTATQQEIDDYTFGKNNESFSCASPDGLPLGTYVISIHRVGSSNVFQVARTQNISNDVYTRMMNISTGITPWVKIYHTGNIIGTVSQSGGVPTGAIIESGSNVNGSYTKYADGTMICFDCKTILNPGLSGTLTLPAQFAGVAHAFGDNFGAGSSYTPSWFVLIKNNTQTPRTNISWESGLSTANSQVVISAIGRWY